MSTSRIPYRCLQELEEQREANRVDIAILGDTDAKWLNRHPNKDFPFEVSGDALALSRTA